MLSKAGSATPSTIKMNTSEMSFGGSNDVRFTYIGHGVKIGPSLLSEDSRVEIEQVEVLGLTLRTLLPSLGSEDGLPNPGQSSTITTNAASTVTRKGKGKSKQASPALE